MPPIKLPENQWPESKVCKVCLTDQPLMNFYRSLNGRYGTRSQCKQCMDAASLVYQTTHKEQVERKAKEWRSNNATHLSEYKKERRKNFSDEHLVLLAEISKQWRINNPIRASKNRANWKDKNPIRFKISQSNSAHKRRAKIKEGFVSVQAWIDLCEKYNYQCLACGKDEVTMDHVVPLSMNGPHHIDNLQPLCQSCNSTKHDKTIDFRG